MDEFAKTCSRCGGSFGAERFYANHRNRDGLTSHCRKCTSAGTTSARRLNRLGVTEVERSCVMCSASYMVSRGGQGRHVTTCSPSCDRARRLLTQKLGVYGLSRAEWDVMVAKAGGRCAACFRETKDLVIDHCHDTGKVRGLICQACNSGLGLLGDTAEGLWAAQVYLADFDLRDLCVS